MRELMMLEREIRAFCGRKRVWVLEFVEGVEGFVRGEGFARW